MSLLKVEGLTKVYDKTNGIFDFNIEIKSNDIVLLLGPNGAGKTTAFKGILGLIKAESKKVEVSGIDIVSKRVNALKNIGAMVSKPSFSEYLTGYEYLKMISSAYDNLNESRVDEILNLIDLEDAKNKKIGSYSSGMKQKLDLGRAIIHSPSLLILDEPFNGMDIEAKHNLKNTLKSMQEKRKLGIIISSHMSGDLEKFANKVVIVYKGKTLFSGDMKMINESGLTLDEFYLEKLNIFKNKEV